MNKINQTKIKQKSFLIPIVLLVIVSIVSIVSINTYLSINLFKAHIQNDIDKLEQEYLKKNKDMIKNKVLLVNKSIEFLITQSENKLKKSLQGRVQTSLGIVKLIYNKYKDSFSNEEIKRKIIIHLDAIRFNQNRGYYFIYNLKDNIILGHPLEKYIGFDLTNFKDNRGLNVLEAEKKSIENKKFGFTKIYFNKPDDSTKEYPKIVCVTKFEPLDIVIGTGAYLDIVEKDIKSMVTNRFSILEENKNQYLFILDLHNINGGDNFATMILNPNRPDLLGKKLNDNYKDAKDKEFRKEFLKGLRDKGEVYTKYWYKKPDFKEPKPKMSYFYLQKDWNWIIASGFYFDDLEKQIQDKQNSIKIYMDKVIYESIKTTVLLSLIILLISVSIVLRIDNIIKNYINQLSKVSDDIKLLNMLLESKVNKKVEEIREKDTMLIHQSRLASMGEMIGNIAHQWRQPLNVLGIKNMTLQTYYEAGKVDDKFIDKYITDTSNTIQHMSNTIDDFRDFFKPDKEKEDFNIYDTVEKSISVIKDSFTKHNIICNLNGNHTITINGYQNEFSQVILNLLTNAKDAIKQSGIENGKITIDISEVQNQVVVKVNDDAGGVPKDIIDKVFEPYFTTKHKSQGTGVGLYMSKMIIENNMGGELSVENDEYGAVFTIILRKEDVEKYENI